MEPHAAVIRDDDLDVWLVVLAEGPILAATTRQDVAVRLTAALNHASHRPTARPGRLRRVLVRWSWLP